MQLSINNYYLIQHNVMVLAALNFYRSTIKAISHDEEYSSIFCLKEIIKLFQFEEF